MDDETRQRLNVRTIQTSFHAAMDSTGPRLGSRHVARAHQLLDEARMAATSDLVRASIDGAQREIDARAPASETGL